MVTLGFGELITMLEIVQADCALATREVAFSQTFANQLEKKYTFIPNTFFKFMLHLKRQEL